MSHCIKVLELFSGIGGMHFALKEAENILGGPAILNFDIVRAIDISDIANQVYKHNFPKVDVKGSNICGLTAEMLDKMAIEAIFMSPPCQPFTRQGHQKDLKDSRSQPLVHIVEELIPKAKKLNYILLENVKGFENSEAHQMLITSLCNHGFKYQEFLICPKQLGIPNSRLRYYIIAKKSGEFLHQKQDNHLITDLSTLDSTIIDKFKKRPIKLKQYLNDAQDPFQDHLERLDLDAKVLDRHAEVLDIVNSESEGSCCFTKSYGRYAEGTGSVLHQSSGDLECIFAQAGQAETTEDRLEHLRKLKLRYFTPYEVSKLMGFPPEQFSFPLSYYEKPLHCFRVLGNSLNVTVVSLLTVLLMAKN